MGTVEIKKSKKNRQQGLKERKRQITMNSQKICYRRTNPTKKNRQLKNIEHCKFIGRLIV